MTIDDAFAFYRDEVVPALAIAQKLAHGYPDAVANEVRSALTHLARASEGAKHADGSALAPAERAEEVRLACGHLKRICLDSYKISVLNRAEAIDELVKGVEADNMALPAPVYAEIRALRERRLSSGIDEGKSPPNGTVGDLKSLLNDYDALVTKLREDHGGELAGARKRIARNRWIKGNSIGFILGVLASWVATALGTFPTDRQMIWDAIVKFMRHS